MQCSAVHHKSAAISRATLNHEHWRWCTTTTPSSFAILHFQNTKNVCVLEESTESKMKATRARMLSKKHASSVPSLESVRLSVGHALCAALPPMLLPSNRLPISIQLDPNVVASRTPSQLAGSCGGANRSALGCHHHGRHAQVQNTRTHVSIPMMAVSPAK